MFKREVDSIRGNVERMRQHVRTLVDKNGIPKPGVSVEELQDTLESVRALNTVLEDGLYSFQAMKPEMEEVRESNENCKNYLEKLQKKYNISVSPLLKRMYGVS